MNRCIQKVLAECARWKVPVIFSEESATCAYESSIHHGLSIEHWRRIHISCDFVRERHYGRRAACALLHELSHVLQGYAVDDEVGSGMLGFEYATARLLKLQGWSDWMDDYTATGGDPWPLTPSRDRGIDLRRSKEAAYERGLLDASFRPTYERL